MNELATPPSPFVLPFQIVSHEILLQEIAALSLTHFSEQLVQPALINYNRFNFPIALLLLLGSNPVLL
jgi:hypothetical protein